MVAQILDGKKVAAQIKSEIKNKIAVCTIAARSPGLAVILVGDDPASQIYVKNKEIACDEVGIQSFAYFLPTQTTQNELLQLIDELNQQKKVDGILVQLPLPTHIDSHAVINAIHPQKDVDGFHPYNLGRLMQFQPMLRPCTPYGIMQLLTTYDIKLFGLHAVVVGASNIVGKPMAMELLMAKCTVTICHSATQDLQTEINHAQLLISAIGNPGVIHSEWIQSDAIVVDVGMNKMNGKLCGDIDFATANKKASWITPVPGGVGPMTVAMLLSNTLKMYLTSI